MYKPEITIGTSTNNHAEIGDFYLHHYLYMVGFMQETIDYYEFEIKFGRGEL